MTISDFHPISQTILLFRKDLINSMNTMYSKDSERYHEIEQICKRIFPDIKKIHPEPLTGKSITLVIEKMILPIK